MHVNTTVVEALRLLQEKRLKDLIETAETLPPISMSMPSTAVDLLEEHANHVLGQVSGCRDVISVLDEAEDELVPHA